MVYKPVVAFGERRLAVVVGASFADIDIVVAVVGGDGAVVATTIVLGKLESADVGGDATDSDSDYEDEVEEVRPPHSLRSRSDDDCYSQHYYCDRYHLGCYYY